MRIYPPQSPSLLHPVLKAMQSREQILRPRLNNPTAKNLFAFKQSQWRCKRERVSAEPRGAPSPAVLELSTGQLSAPLLAHRGHLSQALLHPDV